MHASDNTGTRVGYLGLFACILTVIVFVVADQALNFDPCNNVFKQAGVECLESGWGGVLVGLFFAFIGASIAVGAVVRGRKVLGNRLEAFLLGWIGLCMTAIGTAAMYAGFSMIGSDLSGKSQGSVEVQASSADRGNS